MTRRLEFRRALSAAVIHDFFNVMVVAILLPLEIATGFLRKTSTFLASALFGTSSLSFSSPVKVIIDPAVGLVKGGLADLPKGVGGTILVVLGAVMLLFSLYLLTKILRSLLIARIEAFFHRTIGNSGILAILMGLVITALVQSSSITTSLLVPMAAAGAISLAQVFPITLGANLGTTVTAILAALAGNVAGLTIAFSHLLFNLIGIALIYPIPFIRRIPLRMAEGLGRIASRSRFWAIAFVLGMFFVVPGILLFVWRALT
jgi:sodium-dependent phosphate cotransporter